MADDDIHSNSDEEAGGGSKPRGKSRRELPPGAVATLKAWLMSPEHFAHPYPTPQDQVMLMQKTGIDKKQLKNWFTNARRRIWKPMLKKQLEQGKLAATGTSGGGVVAVPGVVPGLMAASMAPGQFPGQPAILHQPAQSNIQAMYQTPAPLPPPAASVPAPAQFYDPNSPAAASLGVAASSAKYIAAPAGAIAAANAQQHLNKTNSHAVLMELFARDQDLVRQARESVPGTLAGQGSSSPSKPQAHPLSGQQLQQGGSAQQQLQHPSQAVSSQHPMKTTPSHGRLPNVPTLNSWPHFSSVSSLNNLGTMPGVKSISSLGAAADFAMQQDPANAFPGNLAQGKSFQSMGQSMGKNDSYAFLEVFFGDRGGERSSNALSSMGGGVGAGTYRDQRGIKRERDEDNDVGLSLEDESSPSTTGQGIKQEAVGGPSADCASFDFASSNPYAADKIASGGSNDALKRAYDDAMAARGLMSVSRSSEKLTDLVLPKKVQRTLSQEFMRQQQQQQTVTRSTFL